MGKKFSGEAQALTTQQVVKLAGVATSTLNYWVHSGLCQPSLVGPGGKRATRYWSTRDVVAVRAIRALREVGCSLQKLREVRAVLDSVSEDLSGVVLAYTGRDVLLIQSDGVQSVLRQVGQVAFEEATFFMTLPLRTWLREAESSAQLIDLESIRARRRLRADRHGPVFAVIDRDVS